MIETVSPEVGVSSRLSELEHRQFAEIATRLAIDLDLVEDADAYMTLIETLGDPDLDLQGDKLIELETARDELLAEFLEQPHDAFMAEVMNYARLCEGRSLSWVDDFSKAKITEFITTNHETKLPDLHFTITEYPEGRIAITAEVPMRGEMIEQPALPFYIRADNTGTFNVEQQVWERGEYKYVSLRTEPGELGDDRLRRFFNFSTEAVHRAYTRDPEIQAQINKTAKQLLIDKKLFRLPNRTV